MSATVPSREFRLPTNPTLVASPLVMGASTSIRRMARRVRVRGGSRGAAASDDSCGAAASDDSRGAAASCRALCLADPMGEWARASSAGVLAAARTEASDQQRGVDLNGVCRDVCFVHRRIFIFSSSASENACRDRLSDRGNRCLRGTMRGRSLPRRRCPRSLPRRRCRRSLPRRTTVRRIPRSPTAAARQLLDFPRDDSMSATVLVARSWWQRQQVPNR